MFKFITKEEPIKVETLKILIYGEAGVGKTTTANTANNVITLDFDNGIYRAKNKNAVIQINSWDDIANNLQAFLKAIEPYDTICIDTIDTMIEYFLAFIKSCNPKIKNNLQIYGKLKEEFSIFFSLLATMKKDIIMISHMKEYNEPEKIRRPQITGSAYNLVTQTADFIGYIYKSGTTRLLNFNSDGIWMGKNSAEISEAPLPNYSLEPNYFSVIIQQMKDYLNVQNVNNSTEDNIMTKITQEVKNCKTANELNDILKEIKEQTKSKQSMKAVFNLTEKQANIINCVFDSNSKQYIQIDNDDNDFDNILQ